MGFDYDKFKEQEEGGSHWATYSDLFMVLSLVFLLLYVVSSLRNGTFGLHQQAQFQKVKKENEDLKSQLKVYDTLKENYLETGASNEEQKVYENLMDQLNLLQGEASKEKRELRMQAEENERKEMALNKYQQVVRNIINSNLVAQARIKRRDGIIEEKSENLKVKDQEISQLQESVEAKQAQLQSKQSQIKKINSQLDQKVKQLQWSLKNQKISKKKFSEQLKQVKSENSKKLSLLQKESSKVTKELAKANSELKEAQSNLGEVSEKLMATAEEKAVLIAKMESQTESNIQKMDQLKSEFEEEQRKAQADFEKEINKIKMSAEERAEKEKKFRLEASERASLLAQNIDSLKSKIQRSEAEMNTLKNRSSSMEQKVSELKSQKTNLSRELKRMQSIANARKSLISQIKKNFAKEGIHAQVDENTGEVVISFGDEYFDTGKANLKTGMRQKLEKLMPTYSKSLFEDPKTAEKIRSVEIVGFASPTYRGKYVNPVNLNAENREAINYNMDLSYYRARSIFEHIFDKNKMKFEKQSQLLPLVKVTGRSFLTENPKERELASSLSQKEYCLRFDCKKAQKVIIKFNMDN